MKIHSIVSEMKYAEEWADTPSPLILISCTVCKKRIKICIGMWYERKLGRYM
jgi:hypothetical protein